MGRVEAVAAGVDLQQRSSTARSGSTVAPIVMSRTVPKPTPPSARPGTIRAKLRGRSAIQREREAPRGGQHHKRRTPNSGDDPVRWPRSDRSKVSRGRRAAIAIPTTANGAPSQESLREKTTNEQHRTRHDIRPKPRPIPPVQRRTDSPRNAQPAPHALLDDRRRSRAPGRRWHGEAMSSSVATISSSRTAQDLFGYACIKNR